jgi:hypothetical protein
MDSDTFDRMARLLAATPTRRVVSRALAGLALGGAVVSAVVSMEDAEARRKHKHHKKRCDPCQRKKKGKCRGKHPDGTTCQGDGQCFNGKCVPRPDCTGAGNVCSALLPDLPGCCSRLCLTVIGPAGFCDSSSAGGDCLTSDDCTAPLACIAYHCR